MKANKNRDLVKMPFLDEFDLAQPKIVRSAYKSQITRVVQGLIKDRIDFIFVCSPEMSTLVDSLPMPIKNRLMIICDVSIPQTNTICGVHTMKDTPKPPKVMKGIPKITKSSIKRWRKWVNKNTSPILKRYIKFIQTPNYLKEWKND